MIPIRLTVQGLYSYQERQEIDFRQLVNASLFGIFGKVGSGKTSLLEAISYALYGEIERLNNRDNRLYNMMNLRSKQMLIDFEFQAGAEGQRYKFVCEARRNSKKHHEITASPRRLFQWSELGWQPMNAEKEDVAVISTRILGLDYENFKRTIIIPQNQFREFLELTDTNRTAMMNRLFKLEKYDLADQTRKLADQNHNVLSELRGLLGPLETVEETSVADAEAEKTSIEALIADKQLTIDQGAQEENHLLTLQKQHQQLTDLSHDLSLKQQDADQFGQRQLAVTQYEQCQHLFCSDFDKQNLLFKQQQEVQAILGKAKTELSNVRERLPDLKQTFETTKADFASRALLTEQRDELNVAEKIRELQERTDTRTQEQAKAIDRQKKQKVLINGLEKKREAEQEILVAQTVNAGQQTVLFEIKNWFTEARSLYKTQADLNKKLLVAESAINTIKAQKETVLGTFPDWQHLDLKQLPDILSNELQTLAQQRIRHDEAYRQVWLESQLQQYADDLREDQPCPLCGAIHHPNKAEATPVQPRFVAAKATLDATIARIGAVQQLQLTIGELTTKIRREWNLHRDITEEKNAALIALTEHEARFIWPDFSTDDEARVDAALAKEKEQQKRYTDAQTAIHKLTEQLEDAQKQLGTDTASLASLNTAIDGLTTQLTELEASLTHYVPEIIRGWPTSHINHLRTQLQTQYERTQTDYEEAQLALRAGEDQELSWLKEEETQLKHLITIKEKQTDIQQIIFGKLQENSLLLADVEAILISDLDTGAERVAIASYNECVGSLKRQIETLIAQLDGTAFDEAQLAECQQRLVTLRTEFNGLNVQLGKAHEVWQTRQTQWAKKQQYHQKYTNMKARQEDLAEMEKLFRAQGFVNYVSSVYLRNLCEVANERFFQLTNNQLKLELDDKNGFQVRDFLNGGEVRSVKTLSGGQTFQAALSLALALSDNIQHLTNAKQNLFFLDEGFGTLDKEALRTVFNTLKSLRTENRIVGIISHVEELQHEIDTYIHTERTEVGSQIRCSWE